MSLRQLTLARSTNVNCINRLPTELFLAIFEQAYRASPHIEIKIALVCRRWRQIALGMPTLWNSIYISRESTTIDQVKSYIERSQPHPLHFYAVLTSKIVDQDMFYRTIERCELTELLLSCAGRWKELGLVIPVELDNDDGNPSLARAILSKFTDVCAPLLERFTIECYTATSEPVYFDPVSLFQLGSPRLAHVEFIDVGPHLCLIPSAPSTLTSVSIQTSNRQNQIHLFDLYTFLGQLATLTHLTLQGTAVYTYEFVPAARSVKLPNLVYFYFKPGAIRIPYMFVMLAAISAPNLIHFSISLLPRYRNELELLHIHFAEWANPPPFPLLKSLDLHVPALRGWVTPIFDAFPNITAISLANCNSEVMMEAMANDHQILLWPDLRVLFLVHWDYTHESTVLLELLYARKMANKPVALHRSTLENAKELPSSLAHQFSEWVYLELGSHHHT